VKLTRRINTSFEAKSIIKRKKDCCRDEVKHFYGKESLDVLVENRGNADKEIRTEEEKKLIVRPGYR
jgi:hypothetical protein